MQKCAHGFNENQYDIAAVNFLSYSLVSTTFWHYKNHRSNLGTFIQRDLSYDEEMEIVPCEPYDRMLVSMKP